HTIEQADPGTLDGATTGQPHPILTVHPTGFRYDAGDVSAPGVAAELQRTLAEHTNRNEQIVADVVEAQSRGRHCLVLTLRTAHVERLAGCLRERGLCPVVLTGRMGARARTIAINGLV